MLELAEQKRAAGRDVIEVQETAEQAEDAAADNIIDIMSLLKQRMDAARAEPTQAAGKPGLKKAQQRAASVGRQRPETDAELSQQSKHALYERAKALEITGRSQMSKSELVEAIRAAS